MAIFVNTFKVTMEAAGQARESDARMDGSPAARALKRRRASTRNVATVSSEPILLHHFARCNPRTLKRKAIRQAKTVMPSASGLLFSIQVPLFPAP